MWKEYYVIFDEDMREIKRSDNNRESVFTDKKQLKKTKKINVNILTKLPKGLYTLALRLEEENNEKLGIYRYDFEVGLPGSLSMR